MIHLTVEASLAAAKALAVACNGGDWDRDYTIEQRALWVRRVLAAMKAE